MIKININAKTRFIHSSISIYRKINILLTSLFGPGRERFFNILCTFLKQSKTKIKQCLVQNVQEKIILRISLGLLQSLLENQLISSSPNSQVFQQLLERNKQLLERNSESTWSIYCMCFETETLRLGIYSLLKVWNSTATLVYAVYVYFQDNEFPRLINTGRGRNSTTTETVPDFVSSDSSLICSISWIKKDHPVTKNCSPINTHGQCFFQPKRTGTAFRHLFSRQTALHKGAFPQPERAGAALIFVPFYLEMKHCPWIDICLMCGDNWIRHCTKTARLHTLGSSSSLFNDESAPYGLFIVR